MPQVSVILPVHNGMPYLPATIESLRGQTLQDFEVLVIDDASEDESPTFLKSLSDDRFRYFRVERAGIANALNLGIEHARSELIARIDADDIARPQRLQRQVETFRSDERLVLLGCHVDIIDSNGDVIGKENFLNTDLGIRWSMLFQSSFAHPAVMFHRAAFVKAGRYDVACEVAQDYDLWIRLAICGRVSNLSEPLVLKRHLPSAWSAKHSIKQRRIAGLCAGRHGVNLGLAEHLVAFRELHAFLTLGELPASGNAGGLVGTFRSAVRHFMRLATPASNEESELRESIASYEQRLRWACNNIAMNNLSRPWLAAKWISYGKGFDPHSGGILRAIRRKLNVVVGLD